MQPRQISPEGIALLKILEGFRGKPYKCAAGVPTIGYGATVYEDGRKVRLKDLPITEEQAATLLARQLLDFEGAVSQQVKQELTQFQFDALVIFCFNVGVTAFKCSSLLKMVNANPADPAIHNEFLKWVYAGSKKNSGLLARRKREAQLYFS